MHEIWTAIILCCTYSGGLRLNRVGVAETVKTDNCECNQIRLGAKCRNRVWLGGKIQLYRHVWDNSIAIICTNTTKRTLFGYAFCLLVLCLNSRTNCVHTLRLTRCSSRTRALDALGGNSLSVCNSGRSLDFDQTHTFCAPTHTAISRGYTYVHPLSVCNKVATRMPALDILTNTTSQSVVSAFFFVPLLSTVSTLLYMWLYL